LRIQASGVNQPVNDQRGQQNNKNRPKHTLYDITLDKHFEINSSNKTAHRKHKRHLLSPDNFVVSGFVFRNTKQTLYFLTGFDTGGAKSFRDGYLYQSYRMSLPGKGLIFQSLAHRNPGQVRLYEVSSL
jgi:hypothetical protein